MENEIRSPPKNDMLSQSYSEGIERVVGTTINSVLSFQVPVKILENRKQYWDSFFEKYSEEISDEVELDIETLQPSHKHNVEEVVEEYSPLRIPMRKPLSLVQHWVNTGNLSHKDLPDDHKSPVTQPSVNKQDLLKQSVTTKKVRKLNRSNWKVNCGSSSSSSVDTAAYILSNANRTKKAEATAIVEGSKLGKKMGAQQTKSTVVCPPVGSDEGSEHILNNALQNTPVKSVLQSQPDQAASYPILKSHHPIASLSETNMLHNTILTPDSIGPENNNVQFPNQNITLMESIEKALKCLTNNTVMTPSHSDRDSIESSSSHGEEISITESQALSSGAETLKIHRKKLYSGRDSPVDLTNIRSSIGNRLTQAKEALHPALDPVTSAVKLSYLKKRRLQATKRRQKWTSLFAKASMNVTDQIVESESKSPGAEKSEKLHNTTVKVITKAKVHPTRKVICQKIRLTPIRNPFRRKLPVANLKEPTIHLKRLPKKIVRMYSSYSPLSSPSMNPVVNLTKLSDSYIKKYTSRSRVTPVRANAVSSDESLSVKNWQTSVKHTIAKKSTKAILPPNTQYIDSDETDSSRSTILLINCSDNAKIKGNVTSDSSSVMDNSSQDLLCREENAIPIAKCTKKVNEKDLQRSKSNDSFDQLKQKATGNLTNVKRNSPRKVKKLGRSGKFEIIERAKQKDSVVLLERLAGEALRVHDESLEETCLSEETSKKTRKSAPAELDDCVGKEYRNLRSQTENNRMKTRKSSDRLVFRTTLGHGNCSDYSDHSEFSATSNRAHTSMNNTEAINNKRNRVALITITSDEEDDLESLIQLLPRKRARARAAREKQQDAGLNLTAIRLAHTMEILSDTTDDVDTIKKNKRKTLQSKGTISQKSVVSIADSTTHEEDGKLTRRSKRIQQITPKKVQNRVRKSKRLTYHGTKKLDGDGSIKSTDGFTCTEPDVNHVTSTSRDEKVPIAESENQLIRRADDSSREKQVNKKIQSGESPKKVTRNNTNKYSATVHCTRTKTRCLRFQTRLFEESDSECLSSSSYPLSAA